MSLGSWRLEWNSNLPPSGRKTLNYTTELPHPTVFETGPPLHQLHAIRIASPRIVSRLSLGSQHDGLDQIDARGG